MNAQTDQSQDLNKLKDEIQRRELIDQDTSILSDDKAINRVNLDKARNKLRTLLQSHIDAKTKLRILLGPAITPEEAERTKKDLESLEADLLKLDRSISGSLNSSAPAAPVSPPVTSASNVPVTGENSQSPGPTTATMLPSIQSSGSQPALSVPNAPAPTVPTTASPVLATGTNDELLPIRPCTVVQQNLPSASNLERFFCNRVAVIDRDKRAATPITGLDLRRDFFFFMITLLAREGRAQYVVAAENERLDKQVGSDASSSGSTSLVSKGSVPAVLGFAVDTGALLRSTNGSTITFRGNVAGLAKALAGKGFISGYDEDSSATRFLRRTSFSFSFDPTRENPEAAFTGNRQQFNNASFRIDLYNKRDARASRYKEDWNNFLANQSQALVGQIQSSLLALTDPTANTWNDDALQDWYVLTDAAIRSVNGIDQIDATLRAQLNKAPKELETSTLAQLRSFDTRFKEWLDERERILDKVAKAPIVTFEYLYDRPLNAGSLSKFNLIAEGGFGPRLDLTFNGSFTIFNKKPTGPDQSRVRDFNFASQFDVPFGELGMGMGKPVLSFAGRYERLMSDATDALGTETPNTKGDIGVGQIKFTIPIKNSGIRVPLSFSFANRTELIKEKEVRGNFGFSFDPDVLFALFNPFSRN